MQDFEFQRPVKDVLMSSIASFEVPRTTRRWPGQPPRTRPTEGRRVRGTSNDATEDIKTSLTGLWNSKSSTASEWILSFYILLETWCFADSGDTIEPAVSTVLPPLLSLGSMSPVSTLQSGHGHHSVRRCSSDWLDWQSLQSPGSRSLVRGKPGSSRSSQLSTYGDRSP